MNGIELQARYSYTPCSLGYCGTNSFPAVFESYLKGESDQSVLQHELEKFLVPTSYRLLIAKYASADPYSYEVVESLWVGNGLLDSVPESALRTLIRTDLVHAGMRQERAEKLAKQMPSGVTAHHSFHTLYIQFVSDSVPRTLDSFDKCRIGWGRIISQTPGYLELDYVPLLMSNGRYLLGRCNKKISVGFLENSKVGDFVSTHWDTAVTVLTSNQVNNLHKYTKKTIDAVNSLVD
ncbi:hypothetical protein HY990_03970 [Candidatus Micrarchaeota archaeon]|nr:hypothetical protein [Candidatus Micrarchaeota archaeon]